MQQQMGVAEPDFGDLWGSRRFAAVDGVAEIPMSAFIQPRVEGELALRMGAPLQGPGVTEADVLAAAQDAALAVEIVDSRIADWRIRLVDTVADDASFGGFACGGWSEELLHADLPATPFALARNGEPCVQELGSAVLGSPLTAVAWLANKLGAFGAGIRAGDVVLSGSFGRAVPAAPGDVFTVSTPGRPPLTVRMTP
jgi:2-keto-4-pentenoate hydratase